MSISRWGKDQLAGRLARWGFAAVAAGCAGLLAATRADAQQVNVAPVPTIWQLLGKSMSDTGDKETPAANRAAPAKKYPEVRDALIEFKNKAVKYGREDLEKAKVNHPKLPPVPLMVAMIMSAGNQGGNVRIELEHVASRTFLAIRKPI